METKNESGGGFILKRRVMVMENILCQIPPICHWTFSREIHRAYVQVNMTKGTSLTLSLNYLLTIL